ncbi:hypothetical protein D7X48_00065 [bacterium D16-50]|nr:hypothetical protein D7X48_00065 [bacterium D16-50]
MKRKKFLALLLAVSMALSLAACGDDSGDASANSGGSSDGSSQSTQDTQEKQDTQDSQTPVAENATYTFNTSASTLPAGWNPHTYQTADDAVYFDYTTDSLYALFFNDQIHPLEGREAFDGYVVVPSMAADFPVDVTEKVKASHPQFNIPESATSGYAWSVKLRDDLKWDDGTPITAQDFVDSLERCLRPELLNYRSSDYNRGTYAVVNAENYALAGNPVFQSFADAGTTYADFIANGGTDDQVAVDMNGFWGVTGPDSRFNWGYITDDNMVRDPAVAEGEDEDYVSAKYLWDNYLGPDGAYAGSGYDSQYAGTISYPYEAGYSFDNVGLFVSGDNELTFVYANALEGFYLMTYGMSTQYLVKSDLYDANLKETESASGSVWSSTYGTGMDTSVSYGPYKMSEFQADKLMHFVRNENWWGWDSDVYTYVDPEDGNTYQMYQTTDVDIQYVKESATRKQMFLAGQLISYGLQSEDFDQYRTSDYYYATPAETIYFLLFNGHEKVIQERENAADFDKNTTDLEMQMLENFRRACAVAIDRENFAATVSPSRQGGYAFVGNTYIYDPETCAYYRDTPQAKQALVDFYSIDLANYDNDLDKAVDAITGYDPETAKAKFQEAYEEGIEKGYITDTDGDGKSDQTITMVYAMSDEVDDFFRKTFEYLNTSLNKAAEGTGLEGKILITPSAPVGNKWSDNLRNGVMDTQMAGWSGATLDPFGMADTWTDANKAYWGNWFDASKYDLTINLDGADITMSVRDWALCLNGAMKTAQDGKEYNFGYGQTSVDNRLNILAEIEKFMLTAYNCVPIMQNGSGSLLSQQVYYVVEEYNPMMKRGGIQYMKYNYNDAEWAEYVASQGGTLQY